MGDLRSLNLPEKPESSSSCLSSQIADSCRKLSLKGTPFRQKNLFFLQQILQNVDKLLWLAKAKSSASKILKFRAKFVSENGNLLWKQPPFCFLKQRTNSEPLIYPTMHLELTSCIHLRLRKWRPGYSSKQGLASKLVVLKIYRMSHVRWFLSIIFPF